jgi:tetratricopeptide (TPR) repeat protein
VTPPSLVPNSGGQGRRRWVLYGLTVAAAGALLWSGFLWKPGPNVGTLINAAEIQIKVGLYADGLKDVRRALEQEPNDPYANLLAATAYDGLEEWDAALEHYGRAERGYPDAVRRRAVRIVALRCRRRAGRHDEVERDANALLDGSEGDPDVCMILGSSREVRGDLDGALAAYDEARSGDAASAPACFAAAFALAKADRSREAVERLERGLKLDDEAAAAWILLARLRIEAGAEAEAISAMKRAADLDPLRAREEVRRSDLWLPLRERQALAPLFAARGPSK